MRTHLEASIAAAEAASYTAKLIGLSKAELERLPVKTYSALRTPSSKASGATKQRAAKTTRGARQTNATSPLPPLGGTGVTAAASSASARPASAGLDEECAICLQGFRGTDRCIPCPSNPPHALHERCVRKWLERHRTCPVCRADYTDLTKQSHKASTRRVAAGTKVTPGAARSQGASSRSNPPPSEVGQRERARGGARQAAAPHS